MPRIAKQYRLEECRVRRADDGVRIFGYTPRRHAYLFPSPSIAFVAGSDNALSLTVLENAAPYLSSPAVAKFASAFHEKAAAARLAYPFINSDAGYAYEAWEILAAAIKATQSLGDDILAAWLRTHDVETILGRRNFRGAHNTNDVNAMRIRQVQNGEFVIVWPPEKATPGKTLAGE